ncbi:MAG: hypothetical protein ACFCU1_03385 [Sumerlaeia bacterium]
MPRDPLIENATITARKDLAEGLALFRVRHDLPDFFQSFIPGQYAILGLNHEEKGPVQRAYSIASAPHILPDFEFYVRFVREPTSDNPLTHLLFNAYPGSRIYMGPKLLGKFTLQHELAPQDNRWRVCVAAGTGLAPFTSMVFEEKHYAGVADRFIVLHGARYPGDLGYKAEMEEALNLGFENQRYFPTVSRPPEDPNSWPAEGFTGRVESLLAGESLARLEALSPLGPRGLNPTNSVVFICGLTGTIGTSLLNLFQRGFIPAERRLRRELEIPNHVQPSVFFEQYDTEPILDLANPELKEHCQQLLAPFLA